MDAEDLEKDIITALFFSGMSERHLKVLANCACRTHFDQGRVIFRQGETANRFYLVEEGNVKLEAAAKSGGRRVVAGVIGPQEKLGWAWLFEPYQWQFTARALTETTAIFFYGTVLRERCETDPSLGFELFKRMSKEMVKRLQSARKRLLEATSGFSPVGDEHSFASRV